MSANRLSGLIAENKISEARARILATLDSDRFKSEFTVQETITSLGEQAKRLYEPDDQEISFLDQSQWSSDYWTKICTELSNNFSDKKLHHAIAVMNYLRTQNDPKFMPKIKPVSRESDDTETSKSERDFPVTPVLIGGVAGVVLGSLVAGFFRGGIVGAFIGAGTAYMVKKN